MQLLCGKYMNQNHREKEDIKNPRTFTKLNAELAGEKFQGSGGILKSPGKDRDFKN